MKNLKTTVLTALVIGLAVSAAVQAQPGFGYQGGRGGRSQQGGLGGPGGGKMRGGPEAGYRHHGPKFPFLWVLRQLDLTDEQKEEIKEILGTYKDSLREAHQAVRDAMRTMHEAVFNNEAPDVIYATAADVGVALGDEAVIRSELVAEIKAVLTQEQLEKLEEIKAEIEVRRAEQEEALEAGDDVETDDEEQRNEATEERNFRGRRSRRLNLY